jgi:hypothetical protein
VADRPGVVGVEAVAPPELLGPPSRRWGWTGSDEWNRGKRAPDAHRVARCNLADCPLI